MSAKAKSTKEGILYLEQLYAALDARSKKESLDTRLANFLKSRKVSRHKKSC